MKDLLVEIQNKIESDKRLPNVLYANIKQLGTYMIVTNTLSKDNVVNFCSSLIKLYLDLKSIDKNKDNTNAK